MFDLINRKGTSLFDPMEEFENFFRRSNVSVLKINKKENEKDYILEVSTPGFKKDEITVELNREHLVITAEKKDEKKEEKNEKIIRQEYTYQKASRSVYVGNVDEKDIHTSYENGILKFSFPKEKATKRKQIEIK